LAFQPQAQVRPLARFSRDTRMIRQARGRRWLCSGWIGLLRVAN